MGLLKVDISDSSAITLLICQFIWITHSGVKLKSVIEDLFLSAEQDDVRMTLPFLY
jgi:hypothetical protein